MAELTDELLALSVKVQYLIDSWPTPLEDGGITFPDGDFWPRTPVESQHGYQPDTDTWLIEGVRYSGAAMRWLAQAHGETYRVTRSGDVVTLERVPNDCPTHTENTQRDCSRCARAGEGTA